ncbi:unnamed protein product [Echinostoma caproni]|uniref:PlsC domain-containing protein n=1 Tax=Echinostoma caproni TaxID=27848 RepID=A0A183B6R1_9TREM|nr:unnamed protein product [Echinostoma caproni]
MCVVLGWVVSVNEEDLPSDEKLPIVSNHISLFDHLIIYLTSDCVTLEIPINWVSELVWQLFTPFTHYTVTYLEPMSRLADENGAEFAERVRNAIAHQLGIPTSPMTETSEQPEVRVY